MLENAGKSKYNEVFFNMTMPITLYWMVCIFPKMPGFAFGFLTFALFLGFLPGYFGWHSGVDGAVSGGTGCLVSLALLWGALLVILKKRHK